MATLTKPISKVSKIYFVHRIDNKLTDLDKITNDNKCQAERIEESFIEHIKRQVGLVREIEDSLSHFKTTIENTLVEELNKLKKRK